MDRQKIGKSIGNLPDYWPKGHLRLKQRHEARLGDVVGHVPKLQRAEHDKVGTLQLTANFFGVFHVWSQVLIVRFYITKD